jgi:glutamate/tyrosine decarboxylase-like PLP-dependent enzyme
MAHFTALAAARHHVLLAAGWDLVNEGLFGAPPVTVVVGEERHVTVDRALRYLGFGRRSIVPVAADAQGRMQTAELARVLPTIPGPVIVCAQAGNVNTGSFDDLDAIADLARDNGAWLHVDGAFGLWAAASAELRHLVAGVERADSWATDGHKWLNVPYDSGLAFVADARAHAAAMAPPHAAYLQYAEQERDQVAWAPEFSRRARGFTVYAALRSLGRAGVRDLVERCSGLARRMADGLRGAPCVEILNDVVLNQVLVRFTPPGGGDVDADADTFTREVIRRVQAEGTLWLSGTTWHGVAAMRISVSNWSTTEEDADRSVAAILRCAAATSAGG